MYETKVARESRIPTGYMQAPSPGGGELDQGMPDAAKSTREDSHPRLLLSCLPRTGGCYASELIDIQKPYLGVSSMTGASCDSSITTATSWSTMALVMYL